MPRLKPCVAIAFVLAVAGPVSAQTWAAFSGPGDFFTITLPGKPEVTDTTYTSEYEAVLPARYVTELIDEIIRVDISDEDLAQLHEYQDS